jgi:hypothetical protein
MRLVRLLMLLAVATAALASSATAKEIKQVVVCGASGCETLQGGDQAARLEALILGDDETSAPSASAFYTIKIVTTEGNSWTELYVPSAHKVRSMAPIGPQRDSGAPKLNRTRLVADRLGFCTRALRTRRSRCRDPSSPLARDRSSAREGQPRALSGATDAVSTTACPGP